MSSNPRFHDRVLEVSSTTGTGSYTLGGAVTGYQSFAVVGNGNSCYYCAADVDSNGLPSGDWEVGIGTYTTSGTVLSRDSIYASSNAGSAVNWSAGTRRVFLVTPSRYFTAGSHTVTTTGNLDDLDFGNASVIRMNNASLATIRGLKAGLDGQELTIVSIGAGQVNLSHQDTGDGTAANRLINFVTSGVTPLAAGVGTATYRYDATTSRWRLTRHEQGAPIAVPYNSGDFTSTSGTWTVESGDDLAYSYFLVGRQLTVGLTLNATTTSNSGIRLFVTLPNAWISSGPAVSIPASTLSGITPAEPSVLSMNPSASNNKLAFRRISFAAWPDATNTLTITGTISFFVD